MRNYLTKSSFMCGTQCPKRLWMSKHQPLPDDEKDTSSVIEMGTKVGKYAHNLFPKGQLVDAAPWEHDAAIIRTHELMSDPKVPVLFEAAFEVDGLRVRIDILKRLPMNKWAIYEVKASSELDEDEHLPDIAFQTWALKQAGYKIASSNLIHINKDYVRGKKGNDWKKLFACVDVSNDIKPFIKQMPKLTKEQFAILNLKKAPLIKPSNHCKTPYTCEFRERCIADKPNDWIEYLPRLSEKKRAALKEIGVESISKIPETFSLSNPQKIIRDVIANEKEWISDELASVLAEISPPCFYLDFETMNPAIPLYKGTSPYQRQPFQWSLHHLSKNGKLTHLEFLADGTDDPRLSFTKSLIKALSGSEAPIVVYSGFEKSVLNDMAKLYPTLAKPIVKIQERLHDLLGTVRGHYCHPEFMGSYSIKTVAPVLAPEITYDDLDHVSNGSAASAAFEALARGTLTPSKSKNIRHALLTYCERDTLAMVKVHEALIKTSNA